MGYVGDRALDPWQKEFLRSDDQFTLLNCARQNGKSTIAAVLACHTAYYSARSLTLIISKRLEQAVNLGLTIRQSFANLGEPPLYDEANKTHVTLARNGSRIICLPGNEAGVRSYSGVGLLIEDESSRVLDALHNAVRPMISISRGRMVLMSTPFGKRGHFWNLWDKGQGWHRFKIPWDQNPRHDREFIAQEKRELPEWWFAQEYMAEFRDPIDQVFSSEAISKAVKPEIEVLEF